MKLKILNINTKITQKYDILAEMLMLVITEKNQYQTMMLDIESPEATRSELWSLNLNTADYTITSLSEAYSYSTEVDNRIAGLCANTSKIFRNGATAYFASGGASSSPTYSTSCWLYGITLTGIPLRTGSSPGGSGRGALITQRHMLATRHFNVGAGNTVKFVNSNNTIISAVVQSVNNIVGSVGYFGSPTPLMYEPDLVILKFTADVDSSIIPLHVNVFADSYSSEYSQFGGLFQMRDPLITIDQDERMIIDDFNIFGESYLSKRGRYTVLTPLDTTRIQYYESKVDYDSGSPTIILYKNNNIIQPALFGFASFSENGGGFVTGEYIRMIKQTLDNMGDTAYKLKILYNSNIKYT